MRIDKSKILNGLRFYSTVGKSDSISIQLDIEFPKGESYASTYTLLIDYYDKDSIKAEWTSESFPIDEMKSVVLLNTNEVIARNRKAILNAIDAFHLHCLTHDHTLKEISKLGLVEIDNGWRGLEIQLIEEIVGPVLGRTYILSISLSGRNVFYQKWKRVVYFPTESMITALESASEQVVRENTKKIEHALKELQNKLQEQEDNSKDNSGEVRQE